MPPGTNGRSPGTRSDSLSTPASDQLQLSPVTTNGHQDLLNSEESDDSGVDADDHSNSGPRLKKPRISHACQACRRMKIRCEPLENRESCKQCSKTNRECLMTAPRRKRQKTVHRVSELEKKIEALTSSLNSRDRDSTLRDMDDRSAPPVSARFDDAKPKDWETGVPAPSAKRKWARKETTNFDVIDTGLLDENTAYRAFDRFHTEMCKYIPIVVFPSSTTAQEIRYKRPILFLAIIGAAIGTIKPDLQSVFADELSFIFADRILYRGERSLELVQALLVLMCFYSRAKHQKELNFNQVIHVAATMALDLGMGRRSKVGAFNEKSLFPGVSVVETRRTWLGCYYMCANAAQALRHPIFIRWSPYVEESLELLSASPDAQPTDAWLCDLIKAQHIAEEVAFMFSMDDPASNISLTDAKTQYHIKTFERQLEHWHKNASVDTNLPYVRHIESSINLYIHEIAIHFDHNVDDFRPPAHMTLDDAYQKCDWVTPAHIDSLLSCVQSIHASFDAFFEMDTDAIRDLPNLFFVRNAYATVALIKMHGVLQSKGSKAGAGFDPKLKIETYLSTMIDVLEKASEGRRSGIALAFCFVTKKLRSWYLKMSDGQTDGSTQDPAPPASQYECPELMRDADTQLAAAKLADMARGQDLQPANPGPTTVFNGPNENNWVAAAQSLGLPYGQNANYTPPDASINDTTMFNLGLPQLYDFGFSLDEFGNTFEVDPGWMDFPME